MRSCLVRRGASHPQVSGYHLARSRDSQALNQAQVPPAGLRSGMAPRAGSEAGGSPGGAGIPSRRPEDVADRG